jgi:hypothetical protein
MSRKICAIQAVRAFEMWPYAFQNLADGASSMEQSAPEQRDDGNPLA